jgi:putative transposase
MAYQPVPESAEDLTLKRLLDEYYLVDPCLGTRRLPELLERDHGLVVNRKKLQRLRREMGIEAIYCKRRTSDPDKQHRKYPYLLRELEIERPNQVWCSDITYVPMPKGHAYLCAIMDWHSRKVLAWSVSNTMESEFCVEALEKAFLATGQVPEIFNTDQGVQFTSEGWIKALESREIKVSMDGKGRWMDNVFIERLWRSVKYEEIYLREYETVIELCDGLSGWFERYNHWRPHDALAKCTPGFVYDGTEPMLTSTLPLSKTA